ncbi:hypothetical protein [Pedobacter sp. JY14-1]|uniref:hypothetical protein n=1 Tax=Pedobacter sp. JY14-1 TaxID=3034151 RepID=UPI0023E165CA|nr:hypothetical protein [Pedobacter sp. JY14-1]
MKKASDQISIKDVVLDFSEEAQIDYWATKLGTTREIIKSAARACRNNTLDQIVVYLLENSKLNKADLIQPY